MYDKIHYNKKNNKKKESEKKKEYSGESRKPQTFLLTISLPFKQLSIRLEDRACVPLWDTGPWLPNMSVLTCRKLQQGLRRGAHLCPSELRAVPAAKGEM